MNLINLIDFKSLGDERGELVALEANKDIPFDIKRVYYILGTHTDVVRGFHAHKELRQVAVCVTGQCKFIIDDGIDKQEVIMDSPTKGIVIDKMQWHEMYDFSDDCVLLVFASDQYDESDYIRNYSDFLTKLSAQNISKIPFEIDFLDLSWDWLNDPELKSLTLTPDFTRREQKEFFDSLKERHNYRIYGVSFQQKKIGVMGLKNVTDNRAEYWGYIGNKEYWGKGVGNWMLKEMKLEAISLGVKELYLSVDVNNSRAISLYNKNGYIIKGLNSGVVRMELAI